MEKVSKKYREFRMAGTQKNRSDPSQLNTRFQRGIPLS